MYKNNKCTKVCGLSLGIRSFIYGWLSLLLRPLGYRVFRRVIHLSSCVSIIEEIFSFGAFSIFSMMVNLAFAEKSWPCRRKCCSTGSNLSKSVDLILCL